MMERLSELGYPSTHLTIQNRMAPEILRLSKALAYEDLKCGPFAPKCGEVRWIHVDGSEKEVDHSFANPEEASAIQDIVSQMEEEDKSKTVILCPYSGTVSIGVVQTNGVEVCTVDSFQGKEMENVLLSIVRTGKTMGFWEDRRRLVA